MIEVKNGNDANKKPISCGPEIIDPSWATSIKRWLRPGLGQLGTYPPKPVSLPIIPKADQLGKDVLPKISIVVPSFNQGEFIGETLRSIVDQCYPNLELIVVDGGSTDNSIDIIRQYERHLSWWVSEPDSGQVAALNKGFKRSSGEIMAWINSDDVMAPHALQHVVQFFSTHPNTEVVYGDRILIDERTREIGRWILPFHSKRILKWVDFIPQETLYWRRDAWNRVGGFLDESFTFAMDWDFLLRLSKHNVAIRHISVFLGFFRVHRKQKTSDQMHSVGWQEIKKIRLRELGFLPSRVRLLLNIAYFLIFAKGAELFSRLRGFRRSEV